MCLKWNDAYGYRGTIAGRRYLYLPVNAGIAGLVVLGILLATWVMTSLLLMLSEFPSCHGCHGQGSLRVTATFSSLGNLYSLIAMTSISTGFYVPCHITAVVTDFVVAVAVPVTRIGRIRGSASSRHV